MEHKKHITIQTINQHTTNTQANTQKQTTTATMQHKHRETRKYIKRSTTHTPSTRNEKHQHILICPMLLRSLTISEQHVSHNCWPKGRTLLSPSLLAMPPPFNAIVCVVCFVSCRVVLSWFGLFCVEVLRVVVVMRLCFVFYVFCVRQKANTLQNTHTHNNKPKTTTLQQKKHNNNIPPPKKNTHTNNKSTKTDKTNKHTHNQRKQQQLNRNRFGGYVCCCVLCEC